MVREARGVRMQELERQDVQDLITRGAQVVEVLPPEEFEEDHLPGAVNMPLYKIDTEAVEKLDKNAPLVVYCWDSA
jgi:rhodanese-related sulfurtransferase